MRTCVGWRLPAVPACGWRRGGGGEHGSGGQVVSREARHADLGAALAQDGELGAPVHPTAGQRRVSVLEVHSKVTVHLPASPFSLDLRLYLAIQKTVENSHHKALEGAQPQLKHESFPFADVLWGEGEYRVVDSE